ncbi:hypothetical protein [Pseudomonas veronii]
MTDQAQRLEIATVRAEIGSNITYRFNNDAIDAGGIPTDSGDIKNLKLIIKEIEDKASVSTSIYTTVADGLAATEDGGMFLVQSIEDDEIYVVWRKVGGLAVDTGKRALSSQSIEAYMVAAGASADEAEASAAAAQSAADSAVSQFQDIVDEDDPYKGSAVVGRQTLQINTVAELRLTRGRFDGDVAVVKNYLTGDTKGANIPADWVVGAAPPDDGGMIIRVASVDDAYWRRRLNSLGRVDGEVYGLPLAAGQDSFAKLSAMMEYCTAHKISGYLGEGPQNLGMFVSVPIYDTFEQSFPISGPRVPGFPLTSFGFEVWSTPGVTFQTTSAFGADVFNLCSISDWGLRGFPKIKGYLTSTLHSGSNAVSMVFGAKNVTIEACPESMPRIWLGGASSDGGHGFTIQAIRTPVPPAQDNINGYENVILSGHVKDCVTGLNLDYNMDNSILHPIAGINTSGLVIEECYRGLTNSAPAPLVSIVDPRSAQPLADLSGEITIINCQQSVIYNRSFGGNMVVSVMNNKEKADLVKNPFDTSVEVAQVLGCKHGSLSIHARVRSVDKVLTLGAVSMGGNAFPSTENFNFDMDVCYTSATIEVDPGLAATPPYRTSSVRLTGFVNVPQAFITANLRTRLTLNGTDVVPTLFPGNGNAEPSPGPLTQVIFSAPLTAAQTVYTPPASLSSVGDTIVVIRTSSATGESVTAFGVSIALNTKNVFLYNGTAWVQMP